MKTRCLKCYSSNISRKDVLVWEEEYSGGCGAWAQVFQGKVTYCRRCGDVLTLDYDTSKWLTQIQSRTWIERTDKLTDEAAHWAKKCDYFIQDEKYTGGEVIVYDMANEEPEVLSGRY